MGGTLWRASRHMPIKTYLAKYATDLSQPRLLEYQVVRRIVMPPLPKDSVKRDSLRRSSPVKVQVSQEYSKAGSISERKMSDHGPIAQVSAAPSLSSSEFIALKARPSRR